MARRRGFVRGALALGALAASSAAHAGPALIEVPSEFAPQLRALDLLVEGGRPETLRALASDAEIEALRTAGVPVSTLWADVDAARPSLLERGGDGYHTPDSADALLRELAGAHPEVARVVDVGRSSLGRPLLALVLTDLPDRREPDEPSLRVLGTHHGDEWSSMEVTLAIAQTLAEQYGEDATITMLLDGSEVWVVPVVNPDGVTLFTRRNARGVDLNRNYSHEWVTQTASGPAPFSEPESDAMRMLAGTRAFGHSLSLHSGASNLGWVWNHTTEPTADAGLLQALAQRYLDNNPQPDFWITNGAAWYPSNGDTNDWSFGVRGGHDYTLEVSLDKAPPEDELAQLRAWHGPASIGFLADGLRTGVRGRVHDAEGDGIEATIGGAADGQPLFADPETGAYFRPMASGPQTLTVSALGFLPTTLLIDVPPLASGAVVVDVLLERGGTIPITGAEGLQTPADAEGVGCLRGPAVREHLLDGGAFALHRPGLGRFPLTASLEPGSEGCVRLALDPTVVPNAFDRVGAFTLLATDVLGEAVDARALAVVFTSPSPRSILQNLVVGPAGKAGPGWTLTLEGVALPEGGTLDLLGPDAVVRRPWRRLPDGAPEGDGVGALSATFDSARWPDGAFSLRVAGGGQLVAVQAALRYEGGAATSVFVPDPGDDDDSANDDDDSAGDDDDSAGDDDDSAPLPAPPDPDCADCAEEPLGSALPLLALSGLLRRRRPAR